MVDNNNNTKRKPGRPRSGRPRDKSHRIAITLATSDYELLEGIAEKTNTRPATMIRELIIECRSTYESMFMALNEIESGNPDKAISLMGKSFLEAQAKASNELEKSKK